ncbi:baculoviral IAP repeat-containing protein 1-like [Pseudophryne corroboree]|uniref:baculoviral IAP repeat-containing protein 1-like n=1 Tax=Pseudophryne corroboree TaxID=495146 RepID=UPI003081A24D
MDLINISEFDPSFKPTLPSYFMHADIGKMISKMEENHRKIREQLPKGPNYSMRSEAKRLRNLLNLEPMSTWSPQELASAGFFRTGVDYSCQCFSCGLVLCKQSIIATPLENHRKFNPMCGFIQGDDVGNISKYDIRLQPALKDSKESMQNEQIRLQSFTCWPVYALLEPRVLAQAGFFFTGTRDTVQCFSCAGCLGNWEENDDPWREHAKWFPECEFLRSRKSKDDIRQYIKNYAKFEGLTSISFTSILVNREVAVPEMANTLFCETLETLKKQLIEKYHDPAFYNMTPFGDTVSIDLTSLFADISVVLKDTRNHIMQHLTLPDILSELRDITMIEGEAGSGKTALLKKIAILWASGRCPVLSRFSLVFYISLSSSDSQHSLCDIIRQQLTGSTTSLTEETLGNIIKQLKEKVLFLLDDYGLMDSTPGSIEELLQKNPWNRVSLSVTVGTDKGWKLRQNARTILSIQGFPLNSTLYLVKKLFSHDIEWVKTFLMKLETLENLRAVLQTPLIVLAQCSSWIQHPGCNIFSDIHAFKAYLKYYTLKFPNEIQLVHSLVSTCGELSLKGLFQRQFHFTEHDLRAAGVESDKAVKFGLLSKFTAQRLQSMYRFFDSSFQEFLAGKKLSELLESENQVELDKGYHYLHQINSFLKLIGPYSYFLRYASMISTKTTAKILTYLFSLYDRPEALDSHLDSREHLQRHPELELEEDLFIYTLHKAIPEEIHVDCMDRLMTFAIEASVESKSLPDCAPIIMKFLNGKTMSFSVSPLIMTSSRSLLIFIKNYPESISLFSCVKLFMYDTRMSHKAPTDVSGLAQAYEKYGVPTVERDYSSAYLSFHKTMQDNEEKTTETDKFLSLFPQEIVIGDIIVQSFMSLMGYKVPIFKVQAVGINSGNFSQLNCEKFQILFSMSDHIEIQLINCRDFLKNIGSAIEGSLRSFRKLIICNTYLSTEEQNLILKMSSLESLEIENSQGTCYPELLVCGIHKFPCLTEVSIVLPKNPEIVDHLPDEFQGLSRMKKIVFQSSNCRNESTKFVQYIQSFPDLEVVHLGFGNLDCEGLMDSLATCKKLKELNLCGSVLKDTDMALLAQTMKNFMSLKILNLNKEKIIGQDIAEIFAAALGSLTHLEKLWLPVGEGMAHAAKLIVEQFQNLPNLQFLTMMEILDDESIVLLAEAAKNSFLTKLQQLELQMNSEISESGWTTFFERAGNMPELNRLDISRLYTQSIKSHATTVTSFVQLVSRLPSLVTINMLGWLLDEDDFNMFNAMKENHPQSNRLTIAWQWYLLNSPIIED